MSNQISRRDFLKLSSAGIAATVLTGCGPASRYVKREPYFQMPEYSYNGLSTYFATTCRECPAGCGTVVRTMQGRALKIEGNKNHPVSLGKTCARGQAAVQGLYNPDRFQHPFKRARRGNEDLTQLNWEDATQVVKDALTANQSSEIAFLFGLGSDHLADLLGEISKVSGSPSVLRYGAFEMFEARATLAMASSQVFGISTVPYFDLASADLTFSFGANFLETYQSPVAYTRLFARMRQGHPGKRGYLVQFEPRLSQTAATADEWISLAPGTEGLAALAIGRLVAEARGGDIPAAYQNVDLPGISSMCDIQLAEFQRLAGLFANAARPLAIPGSSALAASNGLEAGKAVLALNVLAGNPGKAGGVFLTPALPVNDTDSSLPNNLADLQKLIDQMDGGAIKVLFVHGANPLFELPAALGFSEALAKVPQVISFASFPDETALQADYIFPDHTGLEAWGYQKVITGADRPVISGLQPVVAPFYDTHATADVFLAAVQAIGGDLATAVPYKDEVEFLQHSLSSLITEKGFFNAPEINIFWAQWQQNGGWWNQSAGLGIPVAQTALQDILSQPGPEFDGDGDFFLHVFPSPLLSDGSGANKPWLQETPDPTTTVIWNSWVEMNPGTASKLGLEEDDLVKITSPFGEIEATVYWYPGIRPDTIAIPFGQGHTALGRFAQGVGVNPGQLLGKKLNAAGDLALSSVKVKIEKVGRKQPLARFESKLGVYGKP